MASKGEETALGTARGRFIESLPRKALELRGAIALLTATPAAEGPREDMRRRLHTLYASALVFRNDGLALAVKEGIDRLDAARDQNRPLTAEDLDVLTLLVKRIPELRGDEVSSSVAPVPATPQQSVSMSGRPPGREPRTLLGLQPVVAPPSSESVAPRTASASVRAPAGDARVPVLSRVLNVLVLAPAPVDAELAAALDTQSLTLQVVHTVRAALDSARTHAPDVIVADAQLAKAGVLVGSLRADPLTDFIPVVLVESVQPRFDIDEGRALGADEVLTRPVQAARLVRTLGRITGTLIEDGARLALPAQATLEELTNHVAEEIRRGIVDAAETGRNLKVPLGEGAEVLAAAWAAVARVRAFVTQQTAGQVRFSDRALRAGASFLALGQGATRDAELDEAEKSLTGRRILVVDDDKSVVWFFAGVLREEGATVIEASDGRDALEKARAERPDVVISDVLMPGLDGFALCRELKRDPALADVPVILISWKEDLLARMRELAAGASGYLRKEAGAAHIVSAVRDALKPRTELEAQLRASGEVRGNLEGTGVVPLLRSVRRVRPDARVTLRDAFNHFECELRDGRLIQLTRTASDGSFTRGERALPQLLGISAGRFAVVDLPPGSGVSRLGAGQEGPSKQAFEGSLDDVLTRGARELGALLDVLAPANLKRVARVNLDEDAYAFMLKNATEGVRRFVERLHAGESPVQLVEREPGSAVLVESLLMELARRGAVRAVVGSAGEDLIAEARAQRSLATPTLLSSPQSIIPPVPNPVISVLRPPREEGAEADELPTVLDPAAANTPAVSESSATAASDFVLTPRAEATPLMAAAEDTVRAEASVAGERSPLTVEAAPSQDTKAQGDESAVPEDEQPTGEYDPLSERQAERVMDLPEPALDLGPEPALASLESEHELRSAASQSAPERDMRDSVASESELLASDERRSKSTIAAWALALLGLGAIGFVIGRRNPETSTAEVEALGREPGEPDVPLALSDVPSEAPPKAEPSSVPPLPQGTAVVVPRDSGFEIYEGILDKSVNVGANQALLIVEATPRLSGAVLSVDGKRVGSVPARVALDEGIHELAIERGDAVAYRFVSVHAGRTWKLREP